MSNDRHKRETMSLEEATISNMWEIAAIVEVLEQFGGINEMGKYIGPNTTNRVRTRALKRKTRNALRRSAPYSIAWTT
ncbi:MAG: hypothetical protein KGS09_16110 [Nitrospirae bacterium]|nr:hypothetical protein [Nitrospirota bacterium]MDE3042572.1 hypothetical protein [Nitrospirota bacterium]